MLKLQLTSAQSREFFLVLDATSGLLATRRRLWHRGGSSALRSFFVV